MSRELAVIGVRHSDMFDCVCAEVRTDEGHVRIVPVSTFSKKNRHVLCLNKARISHRLPLFLSVTDRQNARVVFVGVPA